MLLGGILLLVFVLFLAIVTGALFKENSFFGGVIVLIFAAAFAGLAAVVFRDVGRGYLEPKPDDGVYFLQKAVPLKNGDRQLFAILVTTPETPTEVRALEVEFSDSDLNENSPSQYIQVYVAGEKYYARPLPPAEKLALSLKKQ